MSGGARVCGGNVYSKLDAHWACSNGGTGIRTWSNSWERTARMKVPGSMSGLGIYNDRDMGVGKKRYIMKRLYFRYWQTGRHHQGRPWHHGCVDNLGGVRHVVNLEGSHTRAEVIPVDGAVEVEGADEDGVVQGEEESREEAHSGMTWNGMGKYGGGRDVVA